MPYDIYSTSERVRQLQAAIADLRHAVNASNEAERGRKRYASAQGYIPHSLHWEEIRTNLAIASSYTNAAIEKLATFVGSEKGFVYQYKWVIGQAGIKKIQFTNRATITMEDNIGASASVFEIASSPTSYAFVSGDWIIVDGSTSNDGIYTIDTINATTATIDDTLVSLTTEPCTTAGASITLISRG